MGGLGGIEAGLRQLRRRRPLETQVLVLPDGEQITAPTPEEALRVKAYLMRWQDWPAVEEACRDLADRMVERGL